MVKQYEGRAHHPRSMGNVESDNKFYLEKNYQRATFAGLKKDNHIRIANIDDADILPVFNNSGYDNGFYAPDRKNFIPSDFGTEYIRLWRKENAVFLVSMEYGIQGIYGFSIFLYD